MHSKNSRYLTCGLIHLLHNIFVNRLATIISRRIPAELAAVCADVSHLQWATGRAGLVCNNNMHLASPTTGSSMDFAHALRSCFEREH